MAAPLTLNERALRLADHMAANAGAPPTRRPAHPGGPARPDCGGKAEGGLPARPGPGPRLPARQAGGRLGPGDCAGVPCLLAQVMTDNPVIACMASQYAGWQVQ